MYPHVSGPVTALLNGRPMTGPRFRGRNPPATPHLGKWDETDDIRPEWDRRACNAEKLRRARRTADYDWQCEPAAD